MRKSKFIPMLLIPAAFAACTNEDVLDNYAGNEVSQNVVEDVVFNVSLNSDVDSRGAYAGSTEGTSVNPFSNFYLEPSFTNAGVLELTSIEGFKGDMMGFCLVNGANAITNMPFYVAGYGSTKATTEGAKTTIFPFVAHTNGVATNDLYNLNLNTTLYTTGAVVDKASFDASITAIKAKKAGAALDANALDVRKAIVRNNAGVMTGDYIAYYPYNATFTEPGGVPVKALTDLYVLADAVTETTRETAINKTSSDPKVDTSLKNNLFAVSKNTNHVNGQTKSGDVSLSPLTSLAVFKIINSAEGTSTYTNKDVTIKRIIVSAASNSANTDFALEGKVALNDLGKIVPTKTSAFVGVQFQALTVENGYDEEDATSWQRYISIPFYPVSGKQIQIEVYTTDGKVATTTKATAPTLGNAYTWTLDFADLTFVPTTRKIFTEADYVAEIATAGNLKLMRDITVDDVIAQNAAINIEGDYKLTLKNATINKNITLAAGTTVELTGTSNLAGDAVLTGGKVVLNYSGETTINNRIVADELTIPASSIVGLADAKITTVNNNGTLRSRNASQKTVEFTTLNNNTTFGLPQDNAVTIGTLNNNAGATFTVNGALTATTINNAAKIPAVGVSAEVPAANFIVGNFAKSDILGTTTLENAGNFVWNSTKALDFTVNNSGNFVVTSACNFSGAFTNTGDLTVTEPAKIEGIAGTVTNSTNGYINVEGYFGFTTTKLNINAGVVEDNGTINGNTNVTVAEGAEFIGNAGDDNTLVSALSDFNINGKYTGINVTGSTALNWPTAVTSTDKKIYLKNSLSFAQLTVALNGGLEVAADVNVTALKKLTISEVEINTLAELTIVANSNITVNGTITNNGTYEQHPSAVVWCNGIAGNGNWGSLKPRY